MIDVKRLTNYCYNSKSTRKWIDFLKTGHLSNTNLQSTVLHNVVLIPDYRTGVGTFNGGGFDENGNPIEILFQRNGLRTANELYKKGYRENTYLEERPMVYLGQIRNHWGNFLFDSITRLWFVIDNPGQYNYVFLETNREAGEIHKNCFRFLELFGIPKDIIQIVKEPTRFTELIVPDMCLLPFESWHQEYLRIIQTVTDKVKSSELNFEKVYFSRAKFSKKYKSDFGNELIRDFFEINGYKVIYPEEHTLDEQISIVNNCKVFASVCGAGAHNVIFSQHKPKTILVKRMDGYQEHQCFFDEMADVEPVTYIDGYNEPFRWFYKTEMGGPYLFQINRNVRRFAKDNDMILPKRWIIRNIIAYILYSFACAKSSGSRLNQRLHLFHEE